MWMSKKKKNIFKNQSVYIFKEFIRNESRPNILVIGTEKGENLGKCISKILNHWMKEGIYMTNNSIRAPCSLNSFSHDSILWGGKTDEE